MRFEYILICFLLSSVGLKAQDQALYTQFFYNKLSYNTAFAGTSPGTELTFIGREQWLGLKGSPSIQTFQANIPLVADRVGLGAVLKRQHIGLTDYYTANLSYAYHIRYGDYLIGLSLNALIGNVVNDYSESRLTTTRPVGMDPALSGTMEKATYFNAGASLLLRREGMYIGFSVPSIANRHIALKDDEDLLRGDRVRFWHLMGGYAIPIGAEMILNPQLLLSYAEGIPLKWDLNILMDFGDTFLAGIGYRSYHGVENAWGESISLMGGLKLSENWFMTLSYDFGLTSLRQHHNGSLEFSVRVYVGERDLRGEFRSPRFF